LQASALQAWRGDAAGVEAAQAAFLHRARCNSAAAGGRYDAAVEGGT
jgi:fructose-bisphosphate aldolase class I